MSWLLRTALATAVFFALLHLLGARACVSVLSGTLDGGRAQLFLGLLYALSWFACVLLVPVLLVAGLVERALGVTPSRDSR